MTEHDLSRGVARREGISRSIAWVLLLGLAVCLPFEARLFPLGPLVITSSELMLYLTIASWATSAMTLGRLSFGTMSKRARAAIAGAARDPVDRSVALWLIVTAVSAATASDFRVPAFKFALRTLSGCLLYLAARDLTRPFSRVRKLALAVVVGAALSAALALLEGVRPEWTAWWRPFRTGEFTGLGVTRASGTFAFPNIAAMYWEAAVPLVLVVLADGPESTRAASRRRTALGVVLAVLFIWAIFATASRAALGGAAVSAGALLLLAQFGQIRAVRSVRIVASAMLIAEAFIIGTTLYRGGMDSALTRRLLWWRQDAPYTASPIMTEGQRAPGAVAREGQPLLAGHVDDQIAPRLPSRMELWPAALRLWRRHPLLGSGPDSFRHSYPQVITPIGGGHFGDDRIHANNFYLETLADLGLAGATALALLMYGLWRAARAGLSTRSDPLELGIFVAVGAFFVHGLLDYFLEFTPTFGLWWLMVAVCGGRLTRKT